MPVEKKCYILIETNDKGLWKTINIPMDCKLNTFNSFTELRRFIEWKRNR